MLHLCGSLLGTIDGITYTLFTKISIFVKPQLLCHCICQVRDIPNIHSNEMIYRIWCSFYCLLFQGVEISIISPNLVIIVHANTLTLTSHKRHGVSNHQPPGRVVNKSFRLIYKKSRNYISITTAPFYNAYPLETGDVVIEIPFQFAR